MVTSLADTEAHVTPNATIADTRARRSPSGAPR